MQESKTAPKISDEELILSLQQGKKLALNKLMHRYKEPLFRFVTHYTRDEDISYDIVQETFIRVYERAETFNPSYKFKTWLYQIALNLCRDYARKKKILSFFSIDGWFNDEEKISMENILVSEENIENLYEYRENLKNLDKEINKLPHKLKTALILFALEGNSQDECAKILEVTPKTIETRVYRARKILLQKLSEYL